MTRRQQRMLGVFALIVGLGAAAAFTLTAFRKNLMGFYTPSDLVANAVAPGVRLRLGGVVDRGSLHRGEGLKVEFDVSDCTKTVHARYEGILPDLFREGQGVVMTGALDTKGTLAADEVLAKHDENYMPPQVARSLNTPGHACDAFKSVMMQSAQK